MLSYSLNNKEYSTKRKPTPVFRLLLEWCCWSGCLICGTHFITITRNPIHGTLSTRNSNQMEILISCKPNCNKVTALDIDGVGSAPLSRQFQMCKQFNCLMAKNDRSLITNKTVKYDSWILLITSSNIFSAGLNDKSKPWKQNF